jgi:hypothetical protein
MLQKIDISQIRKIWKYKQSIVEFNSLEVLIERGMQFLNILF